jgi:filamentous hemagglutinin family protein
MNNNNTNTQSGGIFAKIAFLTALILGAVTGVWALPGTGSTNLQTTAGVTTALNNGALVITAPDKSVLTWQAFGSGTDTIGITDTLNYTLPSKTSSVLNIVAGGASTTIDGTINSNGNVFILNPNGIVVGGGARIETNRLALSTSDNPAFASYYFQQNGKLPSQDGLVPAAGSATINSGAIISVTENISINAKNFTLNGAVIQGNLTVTADGNVNVGASGLTYVKGGLDVTNVAGATVLGSAGNNLIVTENITATGGANSTFTASAPANIQTKSLTVTSGTVTADRVNTGVVTANGTNVTVAASPNFITPVVTVTGNGTVNVTAPGALSTSVTNTGAGATTVNAVGALTLNKVQVEGAAGASFTGASVNDTSARIFVYGPASFTATGGNVTVNRGNHSFGPVSVAATSEAVVVEDAATQLNVVNTPKLTLTSRDYVFQAPVTGTIGSANTIITATGNITLGAATNAAGTYTLTGKDITLANAGAVTVAGTGNNVAVTSTGTVTLGNVTAAGTLGVNTTMPVVQLADSKVRAVGATSIVGSALTLTNTGNQFGALTVDVGAVGAAAITEDTTLNLASLRAASVTLKSLASVITTGTNPVAADTVTVNAGVDFTPAANFRTINPLTILAGGKVDLGLLSLVTNLNNKAPTVVSAGYTAPAP